MEILLTERHKFPQTERDQLEVTSLIADREGTINK